MVEKFQVLKLNGSKFNGIHCQPRPDNSAKGNSADLKFRLFSQKYADNSANKSDRRSRANVLRACQQSVRLYTKFRAGYCRKAATRA